jgi:cation transport ATPase
LGNNPRRAVILPRLVTAIAAACLASIVAHLVLRYAVGVPAATADLPLVGAILLGGAPLVYDLGRKLLRGEFGSDLLGGISILTSLWLGEYLAGAIIVLMLSGGAALESYALRSASSVLDALARRVPLVAHRRQDGNTTDVALDQIAVGDTLVIHPHEICPVDGEVLEGHGVMDESYLTGEPFEITKTRGSQVISGAINGDAVLVIRTTRRAADSRYARIMEVMRDSEATRPQLRRLGDRLGAIYTPIALAVAIAAWAATGEATRFLAVLVIATHARY